MSVILIRIQCQTHLRTYRMTVITKGKRDVFLMNCPQTPIECPLSRSLSYLSPASWYLWCFNGQISINKPCLLNSPNERNCFSKDGALLLSYHLAALWCVHVSSVVRYYRGMLTTWSSLIVCSFVKRRTGQNSVGVIKALLVKDPRLSRPVYLLSSTILYIIIFLMMKIGSHDNGLFQESILNSALNNWDKLLIESPS